MMEFKIVHVDETDSTNRWMKKNGEGEMVVVADFQTAGKGCGTNTWESERGKNLLLSVLIHPQKVTARTQFIITQIVSVALCNTLQQVMEPLTTTLPPISIKWPNDIYVGDKKICGVLIENRLEGHRIKDCVIGIGLDVNQTEFKSDAPNPVSIKQLTGRDTDRDELLHLFLNQLQQAVENKGIHQDYKNRLYRRKGLYPFEANGTRFMATVVGTTDDGRLMLQNDEGIAHLYRFKEITFIIHGDAKRQSQAEN